MKTTPEALKALYKALGGDADDVASLNTSVEVLNAIAVLLGGTGGKLTIPDAIDAITTKAKPYPVLVEKSITANGTYKPEDDDVDGYSKVTVAVE